MFRSVGRAQDFIPKGHWFICDNGHYKYILNGPWFRPGLLLSSSVIAQWQSVHLQILVFYLTPSPHLPPYLLSNNFLQFSNNKHYGAQCCLDPATRFKMVYFQTHVGPSMFLQYFFVRKGRKHTMLLIMPLHQKIPYEFIQTQIGAIKHHELQMIMAASQELQVFIEIQPCEVK